MQSPSIKTVLFDFGGVLIDWDPRYLYRKIFDTEEEVAFFLEKVCPFAWHHTLDQGRSYADAMDERIALFPDYAEQISVYRSRWGEMFSGAIQESVDILKEIQMRDFPVYGLTNWPGETFSEALETFPFLLDLKGIVVSGYEKIGKPNPEIYQLVIDRHGVTPSETVFIDDRQENIEAAEALGFKGCLFTSPEQLRTDLVALKVL